MKILLVDMATSGHRYQYIEALMACCDAEFVLAVPEKMEFPCRQYTVDVKTGSSRTFSSYRQWMKSIREITRKEEPDLVHFLYGDGFYKYFGYGISCIPCKRKITTMHMIRRGSAPELSLRFLSRKFEAVIVHSEYLKEEAIRAGARHVVHIEYPHFHPVRQNDGTEKAFFGLNNRSKVIACLGGTRSDKGLDILLDALNDVKQKFQLLVAGSVMDFDQEAISTRIRKYSDSVHLYLKYLTDSELDKALCAADIICLPYRRCFNGASGPLGEGVSYGKCIVGPNHGNLGQTIRNNHLGYVFETESHDDLARTLDLALKTDFVPDRHYLEYMKAIDVQTFKNRYAELYKGKKNR